MRFWLTRLLDRHSFKDWSIRFRATSWTVGLEIDRCDEEELGVDFIGYTDFIIRPLPMLELGFSVQWYRSATALQRAKLKQADMITAHTQESRAMRAATVN